MLALQTHSQVPAQAELPDSPSAMEVPQASLESPIDGNVRQLIETTFLHHAEGERLFRRQEYARALPHLAFAARNGFALAQVRLAHLYAAGKGGLRSDAESALAWLGVAARNASGPEIRKLFEQEFETVPAEWQPYVKKLVDDFVAKFGERPGGVRCEFLDADAADGGRVHCEYQIDAQTYEQTIDLEVDTQLTERLDDTGTASQRTQ